MRLRSGLALVVLAACMAVAAGLVLVPQQQRLLAEGETRTRQFAQVLAANAERSIQAMDILLAELASELSNTPDWRRMPPDTGHKFVAQRRREEFAQLRDLILFDEGGQQLFHSSRLPSPDVNVGDRPYFAALLNGRASFLHGPFRGRNTGEYTFALAHRINDADGHFAGIAYAAFEPGYFAGFCEMAQPYPTSIGAIVNHEGRVVAGCGDGVSAGGTIEAALALHAGWLRAEMPINGFPLRVVAAVPRVATLAAWRQSLWMALAAFVAVLALAGLGLTRIRRDKALADDAIRTLDRMVAERTEALERASAAKTRFLASASHDLRQPLQAAHLFLSSLEITADARTGPVIAKLSQSLTTMGRLLNTLLDMTKLDAGAVTARPEDIALDRKLARLADEIAPIAEAKGLRFKLHTVPINVHSDSALLETLIRNLLDNAVKYTATGGILLACRHRDGQPVVEVWDTGRGIPESQQQLIFEEFHQIKGAESEPVRGLGLGLAIVQRLAALLGLDVTVRSRPGRGSCFRVRF